MKILSRLIVFLFLFPAFVFSQSYDMVLTGEEILDDIRFLSLESKTPFLSFTPPLSPHEVKIFLDNIDPSSLSSQALAAYERLTERLTPKANLQIESENFLASVHINSALEAKVRFNTDISWEPFYPKIDPVISFPFRLHFSDSVLLYFEPVFASDPEHYRDADVFGTNVPLGLSRKIELSFPLRAFIATGGPFWNFQLGRDRLSYGTGHTGNLAVSDNVDYHEFARISLFAKFFKYSLLISQMPLQLSNEIYPAYDPEAGYLDRTMQRYFYMHRLDFTLFNRVSIGLMEGIMAGNTGLEVRFMNPLMIYHSLFSWWNYDTWLADNDTGHMIGSLLSLEVNWNIIDNISLYGQFFMNEYATAHEKSIEPQPPNGLGRLIGINYSHSFENWGSIFFIEYVQTDPYCYMNSTPFSSFIHMRYLGWVGNRVLYSYTGYPRDVIVLTLGANFFKADDLSLTGEFSWVSSGQMNKNGVVWSWIKEDHSTTPSGIAENKFIATLGARKKLNSYFSVKGSITGIYSVNNGHIQEENAFGGQAGVSVYFSY